MLSLHPHLVWVLHVALQLGDPLAPVKSWCFPGRSWLGCVWGLSCHLLHSLHSGQGQCFPPDGDRVRDHAWNWWQSKDLGEPALPGLQIPKIVGVCASCLSFPTFSKGTAPTFQPGAGAQRRGGRTPSRLSIFSAGLCSVSQSPAAPGCR